MNFFLIRVVLRIKCTKDIIISVSKSQIQVKNRRESSNLIEFKIAMLVHKYHHNIF